MAILIILIINPQRMCEDYCGCFMCVCVLPCQLPHTSNTCVYKVPLYFLPHFLDMHWADFVDNALFRSYGAILTHGMEWTGPDQCTIPWNGPDH